MKKTSTHGMAIPDRLLFYVRRNPESSCWHWGGKLDKEGYGRVWNGRKEVRAHRESYECFVRYLSEGEVLHHTCRERGCINPSHLEVMNAQSHAILEGSHKSSLYPVCPKCHGDMTFNGYSRVCVPCRNAYNRSYHRDGRRKPRMRGKRGASNG